MRRLLATAAIALALCPIPASAEEWGEFTREELFATHFPEAPRADAVILVDDGIMRIDDSIHMKFQRHRRTKIFTEAGVSRSQMRIPLGPGERIEDLRAHTIVPPNREVKVEGDAVREEVGPNGRELVVTFPEVAPGVILEIQYEHRSDDLSVVDPWTFQNRDFTRVSRFDILVPDGLSFATFFVGFPDADPPSERKRVNDPDKPSREVNRTRWRLENQAPVADLPYLVSAEDARGAVYVQFESFLTDRESRGFQRTWEELATIAAGRDAALLATAGNRSAGATAALAGATTPAEKAKSLRAWAQSEPGLEGPVRNLVLASALRDAGVGVEVLRIRTRDRGGFRPEWRALRGLNHTIVKVDLPSGTVFADASDPHLPFAILAPSSRVTTGLRIAEANGELVAIDPGAPKSARTAKTTARIDGAGALAAKSVLKLTGDDAWEARRTIAALGETGWAKNLVASRGPEARIETVEVKGLDTPGELFAAKIVWAVPGWASRRETTTSGPGPFLLAGADNPFAETSREFPIEFGWTGTTKEELKLTFPEGSSIDRLPKKTSTRAGQLAYSVTWEKKDGAVRAVRKFAIGEESIPASEYSDVRSFWGDVAKADAAPATATIVPVKVAGTR